MCVTEPMGRYNEEKMGLFFSYRRKLCVFLKEDIRMICHVDKSRVKGQIKPFLVDNSSFLQLRGVQEAVHMLQAWSGSTPYPPALRSFEDFIERAKSMNGWSVLNLTSDVVTEFFHLCFGFRNKD